MEFLEWLGASSLSEFLASDPWAYPVLLCLHAIGMGTVVGLIWMLSLRVLGFPKTLPLAAIGRLTNLAWAGFGINALSGMLLFASQPLRLIVNFNFQLKLALIVMGGFTVWLIQRTISEADWQLPDAQFSFRKKLLAAVTALFWLGAIIAGRYIAYTLAPPPR